jgi:anti-sigma regulatory factor (Ser/Thr protein kinase)
MRVPVINTDAGLLETIRGCFAQANAATQASRKREQAPLTPVPVRDADSAIEFITYEMPALSIISFSDHSIDAFSVMERVVADPWLNNGGIIAVTDDPESFRRVDGLKHTNLLIILQRGDLKHQLPTVLEVVQRNRHIVSQRSLQSGLLSTMTGHFDLGMDLLLVPCYANLVANYLYNMGFVDAATKARVALMLTEMLVNAIEHGNCGISGAEKAAYLAEHGDIRGLIAERCRDAAVAARTVFFGYEMERDRSTFVIRDQGQGFDWRPFVSPGQEADAMALHGRGILLTATTAGSMRYNDAGNEVTLTIEHQRAAVSPIPSAFRDSEVVSVRPEQVIFREGEESSFVYYIAEGEYRVMVGGRVVYTMLPEDVLMGEMSFLLEEVRSATVIANRPGKLIKIGKESLINAIKAQPYYGIMIAKLLARRLLRFNLGLGAGAN